MIHWLWLIATFLFGWTVGVWVSWRFLRKEIAQAAARAAIREAEGLPVIGNPMRDALSEIDGKEAK